jgi:hypothetical protein
VLNIVDADVHNSHIIRRPTGWRNHSLRLNSRKVLWNWVPPYALLAERGESLKWSCLLAKLRTYFEDTTQA